MIRDATLADVPRLVELGRRFLVESPYRRHIAENPAQMQALFEWLMAETERLLVVAETADGVVGMLGMAIVSHPISGERVAGELFWYVAPESRGTAGIRLLKAAEQWALAQGAAIIQMIAPEPRVGEIYRALGFEPVEVLWQRQVSVGATLERTA